MPIMLCGRGPSQELEGPIRPGWVWGWNMTVASCVEGGVDTIYKGRNMRSITMMLVLAWVISPALAQDKEFVGKYSGDAEQLSALGRDLWADIELVALGYAEDTRGPAEKVRRARQACPPRPRRRFS